PNRARECSWHRKSADLICRHGRPGPWTTDHLHSGAAQRSRGGIAHTARQRKFLRRWHDGEQCWLNRWFGVPASERAQQHDRCQMAHMHLPFRPSPNRPALAQDPGVNEVTNSNEAGTSAAWTITWMLRCVVIWSAPFSNPS